MNMVSKLWWRLVVNPLLWGKQADFAPPTSLALDFAVSSDTEQASEQQDTLKKVWRSQISNLWPSSYELTMLTTRPPTSLIRLKRHFRWFKMIALALARTMWVGSSLPNSGKKFPQSRNRGWTNIWTRDSICLTWPMLTKRWRVSVHGPPRRDGA